LISTAGNHLVVCFSRRARKKGRSVDMNRAIIDAMSFAGFWRTIKYEEVYLHAYDSVGEAQRSIGRHLAFYNARRSHTALDGRTPDQAYCDPLPLRAAA